MEHTKTPWAVVCTDTIEGEDAGYDIQANGGIVACINTVLEQGKADAAHIVRCVNAHDSLVDALEPFIEIWAKGGENCYKAMADYWDYDNLSKARAALELAKRE